MKEEEKLKKELRLRMAYAGFLQETVTAMAVKKKTRYVIVLRGLLTVRSWKLLLFFVLFVWGLLLCTLQNIFCFCLVLFLKQTLRNKGRIEAIAV